VQLRKKHGNRFLYKLPLPYLDWAIEHMKRAFVRQPIWLVTGESTVAANRRAYGHNAETKFLPETAERMHRFYDQALVNYTRTTKQKTAWNDRRVFVRLQRKAP
jgi:hypothetical protein